MKGEKKLLENNFCKVNR